MTLAAMLAWPGAAAAAPTVTEFTGGTTPGFSSGGGPDGIVQGPDGNLWFTQFNSPGRVARITPAGVVTQFTGGVTRSGCAHAVLVVFDDVDDREFPQGGHVHAFERLALVGGAVTHVYKGHAFIAGILVREGKTGAEGAGCADDAVTAEEFGFA